MWQKVDFIQLTMISWVVGPRRSYEALSKANLEQKKGHGHYLLFCCLSDPLQLSESLQNYYIWEVCSANWRDAPKIAMPTGIVGQQKEPNFSLTTMPKHASYNQCFKGWTNWATKFCLIHHIHLTSHQLTTTSSSISNNFLQRKCFFS